MKFENHICQTCQTFSDFAKSKNHKYQTCQNILNLFSDLPNLKIRREENACFTIAVIFVSRNKTDNNDSYDWEKGYADWKKNDWNSWKKSDWKSNNWGNSWKNHKHNDWNNDTHNDWNKDTHKDSKKGKEWRRN